MCALCSAWVVGPYPRPPRSRPVFAGGRVNIFPIGITFHKESRVVRTLEVQQVFPSY